jgi:hypothetical protein
MTNVLIGIIGVILFIGLALAGAFYLGPRFQQATNNSKAMSITQMETQITAAISMKRSDDGVPVVARTAVRDLSETGYLKSLPLNPFVGDGGLPFRMLYSGDLVSPYFYADIVFVTIGQADGTIDVCKAINKQTTGDESIPVMPSTSGTNIQSMVTRTTGCFRMHANGIYGEAAGRDFVVYAKI